MGDKTGIEWTDATWNPISGCDKVSLGCDGCYAEAIAERFRGTPGHYYENGFDVQLRPNMLEMPLSKKWAEPRRIFVNSMSDLYHDAVPYTYLAQVYAVMALAPQHTFQVLTKRHGRMHSVLTSKDLSRTGAGLSLETMVRNVVDNWRGNRERLDWPKGDDLVWPLLNVHQIVSVEDQKRAELRIPVLLDTPAAVRGISAEPLLGPLDIARFIEHDDAKYDVPPLDWVVVGGETGRSARPMHPHWATSLHRQCEAAGVPFLFKQWGDWTPLAPLKDGKFDFSKGIVMTDDGNTYSREDLAYPNGSRRGEAIRANFSQHRPTSMYRLGKRRAGRELYHDGRTFDGYPAVAR
ncbi:DUF5131 family protein [Mycobacteroides abscessus]|uniref:DUF5131 family protein n=1 Tax=Mycobacteroides abscessus TaxID=36809 RepID=UPI000258472B|nr:phage Gp37/Gp68 family protein [Mycobacteroides abscessus]EIC64353.1 hypothetical protein OUW_16422 [Mycobacteroides abscessus M93]